MKNHSRTSLIRIAVAASAFTCVLTAHAQRLPDTVRPEHYAIVLAPDLKSAAYTGKESIDVLLREPSDFTSL